MSTHDVPGYNPVNNDKLAMGCWAEHKDGSLILVEGTEGDRVIYSMFDTTQAPIMEYRDAMPESVFKKAFSWKSGDSINNEKWTWHDKTPFDWNRVIKAGGKPGLRYAIVDDQISAAMRVAEALKLNGEPSSRTGRLIDKFQRAINELRT